ncbi:MAG: phosphatidylserine decarboxylase family protein [Deltaproteobacteria bacterium]|nr:phosphatidylserine decarboxylase family protein [Deltaproteobacteria bacterium]
MKESRINKGLPVAKEGLPFILVGAFLTGVFLYGDITPAGGLTGLLTLFTVYFFRDPDRSPPQRDKAVLSPADGKVIRIDRLRDRTNPLGAPAVKVSIFMSLFDVHVNRIPLSGTISETSYHPGRFFSANLDKASSENESNRMTIQAMDGQRVTTVQIAGMIARRIVCRVKVGDEVVAGERFGLIRFGSRLDVYFPEGARVTARLRSRVKAGKSILGYLA